MPKKRETTSAQAGPVSTLYIDLSILNSCKGLPSNCNRLSWEYLLFTGNWIKGCKKRNLSLYIYNLYRALVPGARKKLTGGNTSFTHSLRNVRALVSRGLKHHKGFSFSQSHSLGGLFWRKVPQSEQTKEGGLYIHQIQGKSNPKASGKKESSQPKGKEKSGLWFYSARG